MGMDDKCRTCTIKCRQADHIHETALGRMYATNELLSYVRKVDNGVLVEVVRCKECKEWMHEYDDVGLCVTDVPDIDGVQRLADDFCSYGERKDNDST